MINKDLFGYRHFLRKINIFFRTIKPIIVRIFFLLLAIGLVIFFIFKIFYKEKLAKFYHNQTLSVIHFFNLDNYKFSNIKIEGEDRSDKERIISLVRDFSVKYYNLHDQKFEYQKFILELIDFIKKENPWIKNIIATRSLPNNLSLSLEEYKPFAIWQIANKKYIIDKDGEKIILFEDINKNEFSDMILVVGDKANLNVKSLFNIFTIDPEIGKNIYSAIWIGNRRWDIILNNGILIKLPENNIDSAWKSLIKILDIQNLINGIRIIDLRVDGKIYLKYRDKFIEEIKSL